MGPWLSWESAAFASRRPRVRIPSGPPNKKDACRRLFYLADLGERKLFADFTAAALIERDGGTRKRFSHHTAPSLASGQGRACWRVFIWRSLGSMDFFMLTIEWVLTAVSDCGTMSVVVDVSEFPDCSTIFIWTTIEWVLTTPVSCAILAVQRSTTGFRLGNWSPIR